MTPRGHCSRCGTRHYRTFHHYQEEVQHRTPLDSADRLLGLFRTHIYISLLVGVSFLDGPPFPMPIQSGGLRLGSKK